jgi:hypothetical protein
VPLHPEQSKSDAMASATTSRTLITDMCSAQHGLGIANRLKPTVGGDRRFSGAPSARENALARRRSQGAGRTRGKADGLGRRCQE